MRYQANGAKPERRTNCEERPDHQQRRDERHDEPDRDLQRALGRQRAARTSSRSCANAAAIVGIARKNENSAAAGRSSPISMPPTIVAPDRETPGTSASIWQSPTPNARPTGVSLGVEHVGRRPTALDDQHDDAADDERDGDDARLS